MHSAVINALPGGTLLLFSSLFSGLWATVTLFMVITALGLPFYIVTGLYTVVRGAATRHHRIRFDLLLPLCLLAACVVQCGLQQAGKIFYNTSLVWVTLVLSGVALAGYLSKHTDYWSVRGSGLSKNYAFLLITAVTSLFALLFTYVPATIFMLREPAPNGLMHITEDGKSRNIAALIIEQDFDETRKHVLSAARLCHIATDGSSHHLVVNGFTYFPLKNTYQPLLAIYLMREYKDPQKLFRFLRQRQSSGIVTLCALLPEKLMLFAKESDGVCCIPRERIDSGP